MNLKILRTASVGRLKNGLAEDRDKYCNQETAIVSDSDFVESRIVVDEPPELLSANGSESDAANVETLYSWLRKLTPVEASDERLWAALTLSTYRAYTIERWSPTNQATIKSRFFYTGTGLETAARNSISRLWWFGYLTCRADSNDPFDLTRVLLSNQDIQQAFTERSIGRCRPLLHAVLRYLKENEEVVGKIGTGTFAKALAKEIRLRTGVVVVDALPAHEIESLVKSSAITVKVQLGR